VHPWTLVHKPQACLAQTVLTTKEDAGSTKISVQNAQDFVNGQPVVIGLKDGTRFSTAVATVTDRDATQELALTTALPGPAEAGASLQALEPDQPSSAVISLDLSMQDASVVCRLMRDYGNNRPDTPLKLLDSYAPTADKAWRQQIRDACVGKTDSAVDICARDAARAMRDGIDPPDTEGRSPDGYLAIDQSYRDREWNKPDRTLIEFEWTPCTPYLVGRGWDRWRAQHLNITTTGSLPSGMPVAPSKGLPNLDNKMVGVGKLGSAELSPTKLGTGDGETDAVLQNICLNSATVRTALRDRWANYIHIALRENMDAVTETDPDCPECGPRFKVGAYRQGDVPHSRVTDIAWKNTWLDRQQWLVMVRDHFLARLKTEGLDPNYQLPGPARLVYCGPEVRYGGVPTGKQYYWKNLQPGDKYNCDTWRPGPRDTRTAPGFYKELTISFEPDATLLLSRGPAFQDKWDRDQSRLVGRAVEYLARYHSVAPLVQNDGGPTPLATCRNPLPANGNAGKCNAEAPRRDAVTPRFGDIFEGPVAEAPVETPPK
jgi:hypothetical protein